MVAVVWCLLLLEGLLVAHPSNKLVGWSPDIDLGLVAV
jgi:hypothetical protein